MAIEKFTNFGKSSLDAAINSSVTSITVGDGSTFPSSGNFRIKVDSEFMLCTARSSNTLTVTRGIEGTTAASHLISAAVTELVTQAAFQTWAEDARVYDTEANRPAAGEAGRSYIASDGHTIALDNGSSWEFYGPIYPNLIPPVDANFSWINQGSATVSTARQGVILSSPGDSVLSFKGRYVAKTAPYKVTMHFRALHTNGNYPQVGLTFYSSATSKALSISLQCLSDFYHLQILKMTNLTTFSSRPVDLSGNGCGSRVEWFQLEDDNTNVYLRYSTNGKNWITLFSESRTTFFAAGPTGVAFFVSPENATLAAAIHVLHWLEE